MEPGAVSSSRTATKRFFTHHGMLSVITIIIWFKMLLGIGRDGKRTNRVSRGNINVRWNRIRGIPGSFVLARTIINGNGREIQNWDDTIN